MRMLIVIHALPRHSLGGSEICAASLAAELATRHEVIVCAGRPVSERSLPRRERGPGYAIAWLDADPSRSPTFDAAYQDDAIDAQFADVVAEVDPEIVHFHGVWGLSNNLPIIARRHGAAVAFTLHDFWLMCPRGQRLRPSDLTQCHEIDVRRCAACLQTWIDPPRLPSRARIRSLFTRSRPPIRTIVSKARVRVFRRHDSGTGISHVQRYHQKSQQVLDAVDLFVAPSRFIAKEFELRCGLDPARIACTDNGIATARFSDLPYKQPTTVVRFGFIGTWMPSKGLHLLIDAFRSLTENARLLVYGAAPSGDPGVYARDVVARAADRRITFPGQIEPENIAIAFRAVDVLVVPSLWYENAPLTIREAFAAHTPVVAARCGGMAESVRDGIDGLLFAPGSVDSLRSALRRLIHEPDLLPFLSRNTPPVKSVDTHAAELEALFQRVITRGDRSSVSGHAHTASYP